MVRRADVKQSQLIGLVIGYRNSALSVLGGETSGVVEMWTSESGLRQQHGKGNSKATSCLLQHDQSRKLRLPGLEEKRTFNTDGTILT